VTNDDDDDDDDDCRLENLNVIYINVVFQRANGTSYCLDLLMALHTV
jgi:hypothetical protein